MYDVIGDVREANPERFFTYGYLDGYFKETHYLRQFLMDISTKHKDDYEKGVLRGSYDRTIFSENCVLQDKEEWFQKLANYDAEKSIARHPFSTGEQYKFYQDCKKEAKEKIISRKTRK